MNSDECTSTPSEINRLSECYISFRFNKWFITDNKVLFSVPDCGFCTRCFNRRYFSEYDGEMINNISANAVNLAKTIDGASREISSWSIYTIADNKIIKNFDLVPYDNCLLCRKDNTCSKDDALSRYELLFSNNPVPKNGNLRDLLFSFGFARTITTSAKLGFEDNKFEKILNDRCYSQVSSRMLTFDNQVAGFTTMGFAENEELAETKAVMEFVERYAFLEHTCLMQTCKFDENIINNYLNRYSRGVTPKELGAIESEAIWAVNLSTRDVQPVPLRFIYDKGDLESIRPCSSGFAAHVDFESSLKGSILELIERDAFVRFWHNPKRAYDYSPKDEVINNIEDIRSVLEIILNNKSLVCKCYVVQSQTKLPVVMTAITSSDFKRAPSLIFGYGAGICLDQALMKSVDELRINSLNVIACVINNKDYLSRRFTHPIKNIPDRMNFYCTTLPRAKLEFLDKSNPQLDDIYTDMETETLDEMVQRFTKYGLEVFGIDVTPGCFIDKDVVVTRAFSPDMYPLQYECERSFNIPSSEQSVKNELPHFFI